MNEIDVREISYEAVKRIVFADGFKDDERFTPATKITSVGEYVQLTDATSYPVYVRKTDVANLTRAFEEARKQGWFD